MVSLTCHACKYKIHKLPQRYILKGWYAYWFELLSITVTLTWWAEFLPLYWGPAVVNWHHLQRAKSVVPLQPCCWLLLDTKDLYLKKDDGKDETMRKNISCILKELVFSKHLLFTMIKLKTKMMDFILKYPTNFLKGFKTDDRKCQTPSNVTAGSKLTAASLILLLEWIQHTHLVLNTGRLGHLTLLCTVSPADHHSWYSATK